MKDEFTKADIEKILFIKRTRLQEWIARGFIVPSKKADKKGVANLFTREDVYRIALFFRLLNSGVSRERAIQIFENYNINFNSTDQRFIYILSAIFIVPTAQEGESEAWSISQNFPNFDTEKNESLFIVSLEAVKKKVDMLLEQL